MIRSRFADNDALTYVREDRPGISAARNAGVRRARGEVIAFTDDDVEVDAGWLSALVAGFAVAPDVGAVTGLTLPAAIDLPVHALFEEFGGFDKGYVPRIVDLGALRPPDDPLFPYAPGRLGSGNNMAFRADALRAIGGFDPCLGVGSPTHSGEDLAAFIRVLWAGPKLVYEPGALIFHHHRDTYEALRRQVYGYGVGLSACMISCVSHRPKKLADLAGRVPAGFRYLVSPSSAKNSATIRPLSARSRARGSGRPGLRTARLRTGTCRGGSSASPTPPRERHDGWDRPLMRVLLVAQWFPPIIGGEEWHVLHLGQELVRRGHIVDVVTLLQPGLAASEEVDGMRVHRIQGTAQRLERLFLDLGRRSAAPGPDPELVIAIRRIMRAARPDVVHAHNWLVHPVLPSKRSSGVPLVVTLHDYSLVCARKDLMYRGATQCSGPALSKCIRCAAHKFGPAKGLATAMGVAVMGPMLRSRADHLIAVSASVAEGNQLTSWGVPHSVIPNFIPDEDRSEGTPPSSSIPGLPGEPFLLYVGAISHAKGVPTLLEAYAGLLRPPPLVLIGYPGAETDSILRDLPDGAVYLDSQPHQIVLEAWRRSRFRRRPFGRPRSVADRGSRGDGFRNSGDRIADRRDPRHDR